MRVAAIPSPSRVASRSNSDSSQTRVNKSVTRTGLFLKFPAQTTYRGAIVVLVTHQCSSWLGKKAGCKRNRAQSSARTTKIWAQFSAKRKKIWHSLERERSSHSNDKRTTNAQHLGTIQHANETRCGHKFVGDR